MASLSRRITNRFIIDLTNRKGFDNLWDNLDHNMKDEIRNEWITIIDLILEHDQSS
jgi:hypothetical protein